MSQLFGAASEHLLLVFGCYGNFVGEQINLSRIEQSEHVGKRCGYGQFHLHPFVGRELLKQRVVIPHRLIAVDEIGGGTVERCHSECVGQTMLGSYHTLAVAAAPSATPCRGSHENGSSDEW